MPTAAPERNARAQAHAQCRARQGPGGATPTSRGTRPSCRELLANPFWPLQAAVTLGADPDYARWPDPYGWWLTRRARAGVEGRAPTQ